MTSKLSLELPILLPDVDDLADACIGRLVQFLAAKEGVEDAHVIAPAGAQPARLCIHYDPDVLPLSRIREITRTAGGEITDRYGHLRVSVQGLNNQRRVRTVSARLQSKPGIVEVTASPSGTVGIDFDRTRIAEADVRQLLAGMNLAVVAATRPTPPATTPV